MGWELWFVCGFVVWMRSIDFVCGWLVFGSFCLSWDFGVEIGKRGAGGVWMDWKGWNGRDGLVGMEWME